MRRGGVKETKKERVMIGEAIGRTLVVIRRGGQRRGERRQGRQPGRIVGVVVGVAVRARGMGGDEGEGEECEVMKWCDGNSLPYKTFIMSVIENSEPFL